MVEIKTYLSPETKKKVKEKAKKMGVSLAFYLRSLVIKDLNGS
jgi:hypothetical protein